MTDGRLIADAQAVLDEAQELLGDLAHGNVDDEHPAAFENTDERLRRVGDLRDSADACRARLEQRFSGDDPIVRTWIDALDSVRYLIDAAYDGRYPTGDVGDSEEFSKAEAAAERYAEAWEQAAKRALADEPA